MIGHLVQASQIVPRYVLLHLHALSYCKHMLVDVEKDDLWTPDLDAEGTNLFNAKLFPVPSKTDRTTTTARNLLLNLMRKSNIDTDMVEVWKTSQRLSLAEVSFLLCKKQL